MALTLLTGPPSAEVTGTIYGRIREAVRTGASACLLLPTLPDVHRARHALAHECPVGLEIGQLDRQIETRWALFGDGRRPVGRVERTMLLSRAWAEASGSEAGPGVLTVLESLARRSAECGRPGARFALPGPAADIVVAVTRYRAMLDAFGLIEPGEAALLLADADDAPADLVAIHRFTDLGASQRAVLAAWGRTADVLVSLPFDEAAPATACIRPLVGMLREQGAALEVLPGRPCGDGELDALETRLFVDGPRRSPGGSVAMGVAQGIESEARLAVQYVRAALDAGTPPERIAVVFRDPSRHHAWLARVFDEEGVPADFDVSIPAGEVPFGRAILRLWAFVAGGGSRIDLAAFLRSPYSGTPVRFVDSADEKWRATRARDGIGLIAALPESVTARAIVRTAAELADQELDAATVTKWQSIADSLLANGYPGDAPVVGGAALLDAAAHRAFTRVLESLAAVGGSTPAHAIAALKRARVSPAVLERAGHVQVLGVERLRSRRFDTVVLGGLTAAEFPRRGVGDAFEGDAVGSAAAALGVAYDQAEELARERLLFYLSVTRARRSLVLLRRASDDEGRALRRSVFWDEVLDLYRDPVSEEERADDLPPTEEWLLERLAGGSGAGRCARAARGTLEDGGVLEGLAGIEVVSASDIEAYLACPYSWFVERVLRPRSPDLEIDARTRGAVAHDALARLFQRIELETGSPRVTPATLPRALELADAAVAAAVSAAPEPHSLDERQALGTVRRAVRGLVERDADFLPGYAPIAHEWGFGTGGADPIDLGTFSLRGRADRIDAGPEGLIVIDYKSGRAVPGADFAKEGKVQLQLYAIAASRHHGLPVAGGLYRSLSRGSDRGFVLDVVETPGIVRTDRRDAAAIEEMLVEAVGTAADAVAGMRAGRIEPTPEKRRCSYCIASGFCGEAER